MNAALNERPENAIPNIVRYVDESGGSLKGSMASMSRIGRKINNERNVQIPMALVNALGCNPKGRVGDWRI